MLMMDSMLKLQPNEVVIDPALTGVAHIRKEIGDTSYEAWVSARLIGTKPELHLRCFPEDGERGLETPTHRTISINEWTRWRIPVEHIDELEWIPEPKAMFTRMTEDDTQEATKRLEELFRENREMQKARVSNPRPVWDNDGLIKATRRIAEELNGIHNAAARENNPSVQGLEHLVRAASGLTKVGIPARQKRS